MQKQVTPHVWVPSTYFAEGFPYAVVNNIAEVFFQQMGASLGVIGLTALLHLPWNLKLLWAPLVDQLETKKTWLVWMQILGAGLLFALIPISTLPQALPLAAAVFLLLALLSATNDVAIDGYYMEVLDDAAQSKFVGYRAMAYKVSGLLVRGPLLGLAGVFGWALGFGAMAAVLLGLGLFHVFFLLSDQATGQSVRTALARLLSEPRRWLGRLLSLLAIALVVLGLRASLSDFLQAGSALAAVSASGWVAIGLCVVLAVALAFLPTLKRRWSGGGSLATPLLQLLQRPRMGTVLLFVVLFRTGESFLQKMKFPFLNDSLGLSVSDYALASGTVGVVASFVGTLVGGALISRDGLTRWVWPFILAQNVLNLLYAALAVGVGPFDISEGSASFTMALCSSVIALEEFGAGLGTAVFMVYLMKLCHPRHKAAHFAILTALMSLSFTFAGGLSGFLAEATGFPIYFALTFVATVPMMVLIPWVVSEKVLGWRGDEGGVL